MQSYLDVNINPTNPIQEPLEKEESSIPRKSPLRATIIKKKNTQNAAKSENTEPNQEYHNQSFEQNLDNDLIENNTSAITPRKVKPDHLTLDQGVIGKDNPSQPRPEESPFTKFCKSLHLSPAIHSSRWAKSNLLGNYDMPFMSPTNFHVGVEHISSSPTFVGKNLGKLDYTNRFNIKAGKDDQNLESEETNEGISFEQNVRDEEGLNASPLFMPITKSIYSNTNLIPSQGKADIFSQTLKNGNQDQKLFSVEEKDNDEFREKDQGTPTLYNAGYEIMKTPSPRRADLQQKMSSIESIMTQRNISFGMVGHHSISSDNTAANSSTRSSMNKNKAENEDEEGEEFDEANPLRRLSLAPNKKKVCCNCKKSRCLKLYCDCFARGTGCTKDCNCQNCLNNDSNTEERKNAMLSTLERNPIAFKPKVNLAESTEKEEKSDSKVRHIKGCNCKKSGCLKKYCECFQAGIKCSDVCKCENCKNKECESTKKRPHGPSSEIQRKALPKLESPQTAEREVGKKISSQQNNELEGNEDDDLVYEGEDGEDDSRNTFNPRKQLFTNEKQSFSALQLGQTPPSYKMKADEILGNLDDDSTFGTERKNRGKKKKLSAMHQDTPTSYSVHKKVIDYTPSPEKQTLSGGRTRRKIRPFGHFNSEEYEIGK